MTKKQLLQLWADYKEARRRIELPVSMGDERTIQSFINWIATEEKDSL